MTNPFDRPSQKQRSKPAAEALADLTSNEKRLTFRATEATKRALTARAAQAGYGGASAVKHYLLSLAAGDGAAIDAEDLPPAPHEA